jgi:hypothetical protein
VSVVGASRSRSASASSSAAVASSIRARAVSNSPCRPTSIAAVIRSSCRVSQPAGGEPPGGEACPVRGQARRRLGRLDERRVTIADGPGQPQVGVRTAEALEPVDLAGEQRALAPDPLDEQRPVGDGAVEHLEVAGGEGREGAATLEPELVDEPGDVLEVRRGRVERRRHGRVAGPGQLGPGGRARLVVERGDDTGAAEGDGEGDREPDDREDDPAAGGEQLVRPRRLGRDVRGQGRHAGRGSWSASFRRR